ncbi:MAG: flagellar protein FlgN [Pseudomonas sp.]
MQHLSELFAKATQHCQQFADLLDQEKQALLDQNMTALQALIEAKTPLIAALNEAETAIDAQLQQLGRPTGMPLSDFIPRLNDVQLAEQHATFLNAAQACQDANLRNARLIRHSQHINGNLLDLLRNQGETSLNVYDRQGNASRTASGRPISRA